LLNKGNKKAIKAERIYFYIRLLHGESIRWLYTQRVKLHLNNTKENEIDIEKVWKNLQNILWEHPTSLLATPSRAPSNTYIGQTAALLRVPLTTHTRNKAALFRVPTKQQRKAISCPFQDPAPKSQFIPANQRTVYSNQSQVGLF